MLRMVFEVVMALAVILCLIFITKLGSMGKKADNEEENKDSNSE